MNVSDWSLVRRWSVVVALSAVLLAIDFLTGPFILFPVTFVLPVVLAGWYLGRWPAIVLSAVLASIRFGMIVVWAAPGFGLAVGLVNAVIGLSMLALLGFLVDQVARQQRLLTRRVQILERLLPICCICKSIRNAAGAWEPVEVYISEHTPAKFSHGFCEPCARKHYPDVLGTKAMKDAEHHPSPGPGTNS